MHSLRQQERKNKRENRNLNQSLRVALEKLDVEVRPLKKLALVEFLIPVFVLVLNNMKNKQLKKISAVVTLLFAFAPIAHAEIALKGSGDIEVKTGEGMHSEVKADTNATITPVSGVHMEGGVNTAGGVKMEDGMMEQKDGHDGEFKGENEDSEDHVMKDGNHMEGAMHMSGHDDEKFDEHAEFDLDGDTLRDEPEEDHGTSTVIEIDASEKVHSSHDFEHFVEHMSKKDAHVKHVEVKEGKVEVEYEESAKLFGFIGTTISAHASVDGKDNVEVSYPWYHIFMKKQVAKESLRADIAQAVAAERKAQKEGMATSTIEAKIEASLGIPNLFEIIANTLKASSVKAEAEANTK